MPTKRDRRHARTAQGSLVLALRAANALAQLPVDARPGNWRDVVRATLDRLSDDSTSPERATAIAMLGE